MTQNESIKLLQDLLEDLNKGLFQLEHSFSVCQPLLGKDHFNQSDLDSIEAFTSRFARLTDILIKRAYRTLDVYLLEEGGSFLDVLNRAEKRGLIHSLEEIRMLKDIRNMIAHEYAKNDLEEIFRDILKNTPHLISLVRAFDSYCRERWIPASAGMTNS